MSGTPLTRKSSRATVVLLQQQDDFNSQCEKVRLKLNSNGDLRHFITGLQKCIKDFNQPSKSSTFDIQSATILLVDILCTSLIKLEQCENVDYCQIVIDYLCEDVFLNEISDIQFKQDLLPFIKHTLDKRTQPQLVLCILNFIISLIKHRSSLIILTFCDWFESLLTFLTVITIEELEHHYLNVTSDLCQAIISKLNELKEVDLFVRTHLQSIINTLFLSKLRTLMQHQNVSNIKINMFAIKLWTTLVILMGKQMLRGTPKANEILGLLQEAFISPNYDLRSCAFQAWSEFVHNLFYTIKSYQFNVKHMKLFLAPFLLDNTWKNEQTSYQKCLSWYELIKSHRLIYSTMFQDVIKPFLTFCYGYPSKYWKNRSSNPNETATTSDAGVEDESSSSLVRHKFISCVEIGYELLVCTLSSSSQDHRPVNNDMYLTYSERDDFIRECCDHILHYLFDTISDLSPKLDEQQFLTNWNSYFQVLTKFLVSSTTKSTITPISDQKKQFIYHLLIEKFEAIWLNPSYTTDFILKLFFQAFESNQFPLCSQPIIGNTRTKTYSLTQNHSTFSKTKTKKEQQQNTEQNSSKRSSTVICEIPIFPHGSIHSAQLPLTSTDDLDTDEVSKTTLCDQFLHMFIEHSVRFVSIDSHSTNERLLHLITHLIDTLSKTSEYNFCLQTSLLLSKCIDELRQQHLQSTLAWHIWSKCSQQIIHILNRTSQRFLSKKNDRLCPYTTSIELLLKSFQLGDSDRLDQSYILIWQQLFKALCRTTLLDSAHGQSFTQILDDLFRETPTIECSLDNERQMGFLIIALKTLCHSLQDTSHETRVDNGQKVPPSSSTINTTSTSQFSLFSSSQQKRLSILNNLSCMSSLINHLLEKINVISQDDKWSSICSCLLKSKTPSTTAQQYKIIVYVTIKELILDLLSLCKSQSHLEHILEQEQFLHVLLKFLLSYENLILLNQNSNKHMGTFESFIIKILSQIQISYDSSKANVLLNLIYPLLVLCFQHPKTSLKTKIKKFWNDTFGKVSNITYPAPLRNCLRDLKEKDQLLLPCFLSESENSGQMTNDLSLNCIVLDSDSQVESQQIDIPQILTTQQPSTSVAAVTVSDNGDEITDKSEQILSSSKNLPPSISSPHLFALPEKSASSSSDIYIPIDSSISNKRRHVALTEHQKEMLRTKEPLPILYEDNTQSSQSDIVNVPDTPTIENMLSRYSLRGNSKMNRFPTKPKANNSLLSSPSALFSSEPSVSNASSNSEKVSNVTPNQSHPSSQEQQSITIEKYTQEKENSPVEKQLSTSIIETNQLSKQAEVISHESSVTKDVEEDPDVTQMEDGFASTPVTLAVNNQEQQYEKTSDSEQVAQKENKNSRRSKRSTIVKDTLSTSTDGKKKNRRSSTKLNKLISSCDVSDIVVISNSQLFDEQEQNQFSTSFFSGCTAANEILVEDSAAAPLTPTPAHKSSGILKRLQSNLTSSARSGKRVKFNDDIKVLVYTSPSRKQQSLQRKTSNLSTNEQRKNLPLNQKSNVVRRLSAVPVSSTEQQQHQQNLSSSLDERRNTSRGRSSKLFHPNHALLDWLPSSSSPVLENQDKVSEITIDLLKESPKTFSSDVPVGTKIQAQVEEIPIDSFEGYLNNSSDTFNETPVSQLDAVDPIFPLLIDCNEPVDSVVNSIFGGLWSSGALNYFYSRNIRTIGDLSRLTAAQIDLYRIPPPKIQTVRKQLQLFYDRLNNTRVISSNENENEQTNGSTEEPTFECSTKSTTGLLDQTFEKDEATSELINTDPIYDVDTLIDTQEYENLYLQQPQQEQEEPVMQSNNLQSVTDEENTTLSDKIIEPVISNETVRENRTRKERNPTLTSSEETSIITDSAMVPDDQLMPPSSSSPLKRSLPRDDGEEDEEQQQQQSKKSLIEIEQNASTTHELYLQIKQSHEQGKLIFDDDYIEMMRLLLNNCSHLQKLRLKRLFFEEDD